MEFTKEELEQEVWKDCVDYEGSYQVSDLGRVRSLDRILRNGRKCKGQIIKRQIDRYGYMYVDFVNKKQKVHQLVAKSFIPNEGNKPTVNHKDEVKTNNRKTNLEWFTVNEQNKHSKGIPINIMYDSNVLSFKSLREASDFLNIDRRKLKKLYM